MAVWSFGWGLWERRVRCRLTAPASLKLEEAAARLRPSSPPVDGIRVERLLLMHARSRHELLACAERARAGALGLQLGPVSLKTAAIRALASIRAVAGVVAEEGLPPQADVLGCADPLQLDAILRHVILDAAAAIHRPGPIHMRVEAEAGEARLLVSGLVAPLRSDLAAMEELLGAMGGRVALEGGVGAGRLRIILRGLPSSTQLRRAA